MKDRNEVSYYPEIMLFIKTQIESNFHALQNPLKVYFKTGELRKGLSEIIHENNIATSSIVEFAAQTPPLSLDIFGLITNGIIYELLVIEVKNRNSVGLSELSQLTGYCIVSNAQYGLLVNVDGGVSPRLTELLINEQNITHIERIIKYQQGLGGKTISKKIEHNFGVMEWDSETKNLTYTGHGGIRSISELCDKLANRFI